MHRQVVLKSLCGPVSGSVFGVGWCSVISPRRSSLLGSLGLYLCRTPTKIHMYCCVKSEQTQKPLQMAVKAAVFISAICSRSGQVWVVKDWPRLPFFDVMLHPSHHGGRSVSVFNIYIEHAAEVKLLLLSVPFSQSLELCLAFI